MRDRFSFFTDQTAVAVNKKYTLYSCGSACKQTCGKTFVNCLYGVNKYIISQVLISNVHQIYTYAFSYLG